MRIHIAWILLFWALGSMDGIAVAEAQPKTRSTTTKKAKARGKKKPRKARQARTRRARPKKKRAPKARTGPAAKKARSNAGQHFARQIERKRKDAKGLSKRRASFEKNRKNQNCIRQADSYMKRSNGQPTKSRVSKACIQILGQGLAMNLRLSETKLSINRLLIRDRIRQLTRSPLGVPPVLNDILLGLDQLLLELNALAGAFEQIGRLNLNGDQLELLVQVGHQAWSGAQKIDKLTGKSLGPAASFTFLAEFFKTVGWMLEQFAKTGKESCQDMEKIDGKDRTCGGSKDGCIGPPDANGNCPPGQSAAEQHKKRKKKKSGKIWAGPGGPNCIIWTGGCGDAYDNVYQQKKTFGVYIRNFNDKLSDPQLLGYVGGLSRRVNQHIQNVSNTELPSAP